MQVSQGQTMIQTVKRTFLEEGIRGFYSGMLTPLLFTGTVNMILFGLQMNLVEILKLEEISRIKDPKLFSSNTQLQMKSAIMSGFFISPIVTVMEGVKVRLQTSKNYKSPIDVIKKVYKESGFLNGIMRGWFGVALCRMSNYSYFGSFAFFTSYFDKLTYSTTVNKNSGTKALISIISGGMAGCCYWLSCYPIDVIKNTIQASPTANEGFTQCAKRIYKSYGKLKYLILKRTRKNYYY